MSFLSSLMSSLTATSTGGNTPPKIYLQNDGSRIQFPVGPSAFEVNVKQNNSTININNIGELNMLGKTGLVALSFASFFPAQAYSFCACTPNEPSSYVNLIDKWRTSGKPCRFIISGTPVNYAVTIDGFKWGEKDGTSDVYFSLDFKEYKFVGGALDSTAFSEVTGLKSRSSWLESTLQSITAYPGDSIGDVIGRTVGKTSSFGTNDTNILTAYKAVAKSGGIKVGDVLTYASSSNTLKVGGKNV